MRTVWKYKLEVDSIREDVFIAGTVKVPAGSKTLTVGVQNNSSYVWVEVDPHAPPTYSKKFYSVGTGHGIVPDNTKYIGTVLLNGGTLVFHIYEDIMQYE